MSLPTVTIIGRANTGKSTLFNCLTESKKAIVSPHRQTTRDRIEGEIRWRGYTFRIIDTGGVDIEEIKNSITILLKKKFPANINALEKGILEQTAKGIDQADLIVFLVDAKAGLMGTDRELAVVLKKLGKDVLCVCNKIDSIKEIDTMTEFYKLGFGEPLAVSAVNGSGTGDLLDRIIKKLEKSQKNFHPSEYKKKESIFVSFIGKPNVGKSSLLNSILGESRVIVSPTPMTTREPQDITLNYKEKNITLVDTAGLKKKAKIAPGVDTIASLKTLSSLAQSDIILFIIDVSESVASQDLRLSGLLEDSSASVIIVANKWDMIQNKKTASDAQYREKIYTHLHPLSWAPLIFVSAKTGQNVKKILDLILEVFERRNIFLTDKSLNTFLKKLIRKKRPFALTSLTKPHITKIRQIKTNPPEITVYTKNKENLHPSYLRFIESQMRKDFDLEGVNIKIRMEEELS